MVLGELTEGYRYRIMFVFDSSLANLALYGTMWLFCGLLTFVGGIAMVLALKTAEEDKSISIGSTYRETAHLFFPVLLVFIIMGLIIGGGLIIFIAPGILFAIWYLFSLYTAVIHRKRKAEALCLSKAVVRTSMGRVLGYTLLVWAIAYGPSIVISMIIQRGTFHTFSAYLSAVIANGLITSILAVWATAFSLMLYLDLIETNPKISESFGLDKA